MSQWGALFLTWPLPATAEPSKLCRVHSASAVLAMLELGKYCQEFAAKSSSQLRVPVERREQITEQFSAHFPSSDTFSNQSQATLRWNRLSPTGSQARLQQPPQVHGTAAFPALAWDVERAEAGGRDGRDAGAREALTCGGSTQRCLGQEQQSEVVTNTAHGSGEPGPAQHLPRSSVAGACVWKLLRSPLGGENEVSLLLCSPIKSRAPGLIM